MSRNAYQRSRNPSTVTEPHPTVPQTGSGYLNAGRGGAGNLSHYNYTDLTPGPSANGPASLLPLKSRKAKSSNSNTTVPYGRGGAGNMFKPSTHDHERVFQFDEELLKRSREKEAPVYHIGRGGMANFRDERPEVMAGGRRRESDVSATLSTSSRGSTSTNASGSERVREVLGRVAWRF